MTWLDIAQWSGLILVGIFLFSAVFGGCMARWFSQNYEYTDDPDTCRDKALEMAGDAYRDRSE